MTPSTAALRFRIWQYASPRGWDVTTVEIAEALGESVRRVCKVTSDAGWGSRVRSSWLTNFELGAGSGSFCAGRHVAADLVSGRIGNGEAI